MKKTQLFVVLYFLIFHLTAQVITNYTTSDGLLDNFVECIDVDDNDNIWFGTSVGVQMYDGVNWYTWSQADFPDIVSDNIKCIKATSSGEIWIGTNYGVNQLLYGIPGSVWVPYTSSNGLINNQVKSIDEDPNGGIWIGTSQGVSYFDGTSWTSYSSPDLHWSGVNTTAFDSNGDKWFASPLGGVTHFNGINFIAYDNSNGLLSQNVTDIIIDNQDNKWVGTGSGMSVLNTTNTLFTHYTQMYLLPPPDTLNPVVDIEMDSYGRIWAAIYVGYLGEGGIAMWNGSQWIDFDASDGIVGQNVKGLSIDSEDNIWIATTTGVSKISAIPSSVDIEIPVEFDIFPNPSHGKICLNNNEGSFKQIEIYNALGTLVYSNYNAKEIFCFNLSFLNQGVYYVNLNLKGKIFNKKLIIH